MKLPSYIFAPWRSALSKSAPIIESLKLSRHARRGGDVEVCSKPIHMIALSVCDTPRLDALQPC
eukprot:SAG11_NODE_14043_length_627_cov_1.615530_1_plen_63_part_01